MIERQRGEGLGDFLLDAGDDHLGRHRTFAAITSCSSAEKRGTSSLGLIMTRLPAASAPTAGASVSCSG